MQKDVAISVFIDQPIPSSVLSDSLFLMKTADIF
jgi:hypothetical protein